MIMSGNIYQFESTFSNGEKVWYVYLATINSGIVHAIHFTSHSCGKAFIKYELESPPHWPFFVSADGDARGVMSPFDGPVRAYKTEVEAQAALDAWREKSKETHL